MTDLVTNEEVITDKWSMICYDIKDLDKESIAFLKKRGIEQVKLEYSKRETADGEAMLYAEKTK